MDNPEKTEGAFKMDNPEKLATLGTQDEDKQNKKYNTICVGYHYTQTNKNNVNKTWTVVQTTGDKGEEQNIVFMRKSYWASEHELRR